MIIRKFYTFILGQEQPVNRFCVVDFVSQNLNDSQQDAIARSVGSMFLEWFMKIDLTEDNYLKWVKDHKSIVLNHYS